jgi:hypothetical protein
MTITRIISTGAVVMFALIAASDAVYGLRPCCGYRNGVYVNLKSGKPVSVTPAASIKAASPKTGSTTGSSNPPLPVGGW